MEQVDYVLKLINFTSLELTGVREVTAFDDAEITLSLKDSSLLISGQNLKIELFSRESGNICINGSITTIFRDKREPKQEKSLLTRLFS